MQIELAEIHAWRSWRWDETFELWHSLGVNHCGWDCHFWVLNGNAASIEVNSHCLVMIALDQAGIIAWEKFVGDSMQVDFALVFFVFSCLGSSLMMVGEVHIMGECMSSNFETKLMSHLISELVHVNGEVRGIACEVDMGGLSGIVETAEKGSVCCACSLTETAVI